MQLDLVQINEAENFLAWTKSNVYYNHTHDVRAILVADEQLVSAGVDTKIVFKSIKATANTNSLSSSQPAPPPPQTQSSVRKFNSMPQRPLVHSDCEDFVLLKHERHMELWKLGATGSADIEQLSVRKDGDYLAILRSPRKFLHLKSKQDAVIVCASLGVDPVYEHVLWLAYSDLQVIHIYRLEISSKQVLEPELKLTKIKQLPLACGNRPAVLMQFVRTGQQLRLCYLSNKSCIMAMNLINEEIGFALECTIQCIPQDLLLADNRVYAMTFKEDYAATVDTDLNLIVWSLKSQQVIILFFFYLNFLRF